MTTNKPTNSATRYALTAVLLALILLAFFLRVWRLPQTPPGLWYDEAYNAMDALWMASTGNVQPFVPGNNGREALWHWLLIPAIYLWGQTAFSVRLVAALAGVLTVPVMFRFARGLAGPFVRQRSHMGWFALVAAGWVAVSWWHLHNSRAGFRIVLLPPLLMLALYFWHRAWRQLTAAPGLPLRGFALAGLFLGLAQYTYLPARLAPLIFAGLTLLWSLPAYRRGALARLWQGALLAALVATVTFAPLGWYFWQHPVTFFSRTGDVAVSPGSLTEAASHLLNALSLFWGAGHELYRHHLPGGRAMLGWLEIPLFWLGLVGLLRPSRLKLPETQLVLLGLVVMWLPALLASPPVHALRPIGLLPFYYVIVTVGTYTLARLLWRVMRRLPHHKNEAFHLSHFLLTAALLLALSGLLNATDYFGRWASHPEVYKEYNGPLADLTGQILEMSRSSDVLIPFHVYAHPTTRYLLGREFREVTTAPPLSRPAQMLLVPDAFQLLYVGNIPASPALVLLTRAADGQGQAVVSRPPRAEEQDGINALLATAHQQARPFADALGRAVAQFVPLPGIDQTPLAAMFNHTAPLRSVSVNWANQAQLLGYDVTPELVAPGQPITVNLYWRSLTDQTFERRLFLQLLDAAGQPVNQWEGEAFAEDMYRWRPDGILPTQHTLWLGPETPPGPYLLRLGFFDDRSGERLPLTGINGQPAPPDTDQLQLGLFYVSADGSDPRRPAAPLDVTFGDNVRLTGVTLPDLEESGAGSRESGKELVTRHSSLVTGFHWQTIKPTVKPMTVFLQLLNAQGEVVAGWDSQPLGGLYPTNLWSPGEAIADTFNLPLPPEGLPPGNYRLIAGLYDFETFARLPASTGGDFAVLAEFSVP